MNTPGVKTRGLSSEVELMMEMLDRVLNMVLIKLKILFKKIVGKLPNSKVNLQRKGQRNSYVCLVLEFSL